MQNLNAADLNLFEASQEIRQKIGSRPECIIVAENEDLADPAHNTVGHLCSLAGTRIYEHLCSGCTQLRS